MVQLSATYFVSHVVSFAAITLYVASEYFVIDSVRKLLVSPLNVQTLRLCFC